MVVWMEQLEMRVPGYAGLDAEPERMVARETKIIRIPVIDERESAGRHRVPGKRGNRIESGSQLCRKRLIHSLSSSSIVQHLTIGQMLARWWRGNLFRLSMLRRTSNCQCRRHQDSCRR